MNYVSNGLKATNQWISLSLFFEVPEHPTVCFSPDFKKIDFQLFPTSLDDSLIGCLARSPRKQLGALVGTGDETLVARRINSVN